VFRERPIMLLQTLSVMLLGLASALPEQIDRRLDNIDAALNQLQAGTARQSSVSANSDMLNNILDGIAKAVPAQINSYLQDSLPESMPLLMPSGDGDSACLIPNPIAGEEDDELDDKMILDADDVREKWGAATKWVSRAARTVVNTGKNVVDKVTSSKCICEGSAKYSFAGVNLNGLKGFSIGAGTVSGTDTADGKTTTTLKIPINLPSMTITGDAEGTVGACNLNIHQGAKFSAPVSFTGETAVQATMSIKMEIMHLCAEMKIEKFLITAGKASVGDVSIDFGGNALQKVLGDLTSKVSNVIVDSATEKINEAITTMLDPNSEAMTAGLGEANAQIAKMDGSCKLLVKGDKCNFFTPNPFCTSPLVCTNSVCADPPPPKGKGGSCVMDSNCAAGCKCSWFSCSGSCAKAQ